MKSKINMVSLVMIALLALWFLSGCGDGSIGPVGPQGAIGTTGATGTTGGTGATGPSANLGSLTVNAYKTDGTAATKFIARLNRGGSSADKLEGSDVAGAGTYKFENIAPGTYYLYVSGDTYFPYGLPVIIGDTDTTKDVIVDITLYEGLYLGVKQGMYPGIGLVDKISHNGDLTNLVNNIATAAGLSVTDTGSMSMDVNPVDGKLYVAGKFFNSGTPLFSLLVFDLAANTCTQKTIDTTGITGFDPSRMGDLIKDLAFDSQGNLYGFFTVNSGTTDDQLGKINYSADPITVTQQTRPSFTDSIGYSYNGIAFDPNDTLFYVQSQNGTDGDITTLYTWDIGGGTLTEFTMLSGLHSYEAFAGPMDYMPGTSVLFILEGDGDEYIDPYDTGIKEWTGDWVYLYDNFSTNYNARGLAFPNPSIPLD